MKPTLIISLLASIASIGAASALFLDGASKPSIPNFVPQTAAEIKWGEGSEAGVPEAASDDETYVFAGKCANGETYRLMSYQKNTASGRKSYVDYNGPAGSGSVQSDATPKVMAVRICRKSAEIISANYWESR